MLSCGHSASPIGSTRRRALASCVTVHWTNMRSIGPVLHSEALLSPPSLLPLPPTSINLRALLRVAYFRRIARLARSLVFCVSAVSSAARASYLVLGPALRFWAAKANAASGVNTKSPNFQIATLSGRNRAFLT